MTQAEPIRLEISYRGKKPRKGSAVRIKGNRPKGKIGLKNKDQTEKKAVQKNRKLRHQESNPVHLHVQATP